MVRVVARLHPFAPAKREHKEYQHGVNIHDIVADLVPVKIGRVIVMIDGEEVKDWNDIPADDSLLTITILPAGSSEEMSTAAQKTAGWSILGGVGLFVLGIVLLNPAIVIAGVGIGVVGTITAFGLAVGSDMLKQMSASAPESTLSIAGGRNTVSPWGKVPIVIGKHRLTPHYAAGAYTYVSGTDGEDQYLKQLFCLGAGTLKVTNIRLGENALATNSADTRNGSITVDGSYSNVTIQLYQNGTAPSEYDKLVTQDNVGAALTYNNTVWRTGAKNTTKLVVSINVAGLYKIVDGDRVDHSVTVEARYRVAGSGTAWASCPVLGTLDITKARAKLLRYELAKTVAEGQYEVGLMRTSADDPEDFDGASETTWAALTSYRNIPVVSEAMREKVVLLAVTIKATDQLNGAIDNLNCICESVEHVYSGGNWTSTAVSRNPASHLVEGLVHGRFLNDPIPSASIDWAAFNSWYTMCASKGWTCDKVLADSATLQDLCNKIAQTGRAYLTLRDGLYSVVVDEAKTTPVQHFTPRNVRSFTWTKAFGDLPHGYRLGFLSADDDYQTSERLCLYDEYTEATATKLERMDLWGITDAAQVWKHGRYLLACRRLRPEAYTFETDVEGIVCEPGDLVLVSHDSIAVGIVSGRIKALTAGAGGVTTAIEIDEEIETEAGESYGVQIRADGGFYYRTVTVDGKELTLSSSIPAGILATGDLYTIGEAGTETMRCIVSSIEAGQDFGCRITCLDEAPGVHTADSGSIPAYSPLIGRKGQDTTMAVDVVAEIVDLRGQITDRPTTDALSTAPATPASLVAIARQDGFTITATPGGTPGLENSTAYYKYEISRNGGSTYPTVFEGAAQASYIFDRDIDGWPDVMTNYRIRAKAVSIAGVESVAYVTGTIDDSGYLGWTPTVPTLSVKIENRTATLKLGNAGNYYGHTYYEVQIQKDGDGSNWYALGDSSAARTSETAYRGALGGTTPVYGDTISQVLPLTNQSVNLPEDTTYLYRARAFVAGPDTEGTYSSAVAAIAKPQGTVDIVEKAIKTAQLDESAVTIEKLNVLAKNLVNDLTDDADGTTGWTSYIGTITAEEDTSLTPNYRVGRVTGVTRAWTDAFKVGPADIIELEYMLRAPGSATTGEACIGAFVDATETYEISTWDATNKAWGAFSSSTQQFILHGSSATLNTSYKRLLSYVVGINVQPDAIPAPVNELTSTTYCARTKSGVARLSVVNRAATGDLYIFAPSARKVGSGKIVAQQIVTPNLAAISAKLGEIQGDTADYKLVMGSGGSAEEGTLLLGATTDASYFRRWKEGGVWKMAIKLATLFVDAVSSKILGIFRVRNSADTATVFEVDPVNESYVAIPFRRLANFVTSNTGVSLANYFGKIAKVTISSQYQSVTLSFLATAETHGGVNQIARQIRFRVKQQNSFGSNPFIEAVEIKEAPEDTDRYRFYYQIVQNSGPTIVDVYVKIISSYTTVTGTVEHETDRARAVFYTYHTLVSSVSGAVAFTQYRSVTEDSDGLTTLADVTANSLAVSGPATLAAADVTLSADMKASSKKITGLADGTADADAINHSQLAARFMPDGWPVMYGPVSGQIYELEPKLAAGSTEGSLCGLDTNLLFHTFNDSGATKYTVVKWNENQTLSVLYSGTLFATQYDKVAATLLAKTGYVYKIGVGAADKAKGEFLVCHFELNILTGAITGPTGSVFEDKTSPSDISVSSAADNTIFVFCRDGILYRFTRTTGAWSKTNELNITGSNRNSVSAISATACAVVIRFDGTIRIYKTSGGSFAQYGTSFPLGAVTNPAIQVLSGRLLGGSSEVSSRVHIVFSDNENENLPLYRFTDTGSGGTFSALAVMNMAGTSLPKIARLSGTDIGYVDVGTQQLRLIRIQ